MYLICDVLDSPIYMSTLIRDSIIIIHIYHVCSILFMGFQTQVDLIILDMIDFNIILRMTWVSPYHAILNYNAKTMTLEVPEMDKLE